MTQQHCTDYLDKVTSIKTACNDPTTTLTQLQTLIDGLATLDGQIDTDLQTISLPTTMTHMNLFILTQIERSMKCNLQESMKNLVKIRKNNIDAYQASNTYQNTVLYSTETRSIDNYIENTVIAGCTRMQSLKNIIKEYVK